MGDWLSALERGAGGAQAVQLTSIEEMGASALMALFLGFALAWIYSRTHHGLSYSASFTRSLVLMTLGASLLMLVIGGSIVTAFGLLGALAIVRFRNVLKDTQDTVFVFFALVLGLATGTGRIGSALFAMVAMGVAVGWTYITGFGSKGRFDGHVTWCSTGDEHARVEDLASQILDAFCSQRRRVTLHDAGGVIEQVVAVRLRDRSRALEVAKHLRQIQGVEDASIVVRDQLEEL